MGQCWALQPVFICSAKPIVRIWPQLPEIPSPPHIFFSFSCRYSKNLIVLDDYHLVRPNISLVSFLDLLTVTKFIHQCNRSGTSQAPRAWKGPSHRLATHAAIARLHRCHWGIQLIRNVLLVSPILRYLQYSGISFNASVMRRHGWCTPARLTASGTVRYGNWYPTTPLDLD